MLSGFDLRLKNTIKSLIILMKTQHNRNTYLINICKSDKDFALIYINIEFGFLTKYHHHFP